MAFLRQQIPVRYSPTARNVPQARAKNLQPIPESVEFTQFLSRTLFVARLYGEFANEDEFARLFSQYVDASIDLCVVRLQVRTHRSRHVPYG